MLFFTFVINTKFINIFMLKKKPYYYLFLIIFLFCTINKSHSQITVDYYLNSTFQTTTQSVGGDGDYITLPNLTLQNKFSIEVWFKLDLFKKANNMRIFELDYNNDTISQDINIMLGFLSNTNSNTLIANYGNGIKNYNLLNFIPSFNAGNWNHYAITVSNNTAKIFVNGVRIANETNAFNNIYNAPFVKNYLGRAINNSTSSTIGNFSRLTVYDTSISDQQILNNYNNLWVPLNTNHLYYCLMLDNKVQSTTPINNGTTLPNQSLSNIAINANATIQSKNNFGAYYFYDPTYKYYFGQTGTYTILEYSVSNKRYEDRTYIVVPSPANYTQNFMYYYNSPLLDTNGFSYTANAYYVYAFTHYNTYYYITSASLSGSVSPSTPINVVATNNFKLTYNRDSFKAIVAFTPSLYNGGNSIKKYIVTSFPDYITASGTSSPITVTGLQEGVVYTFGVQAVNDIGNSGVTYSNPISTKYFINYIDELDSIGISNIYLTNNSYVLTKNLDFTSPSSYSNGIVNNNNITGQGFNPIKNFTGKFNGNGYYIKNLFINKPTQDSIGLFATIADSITNLSIIGANITGNNLVGGIAGFANGAVINNCYISDIANNTNVFIKANGTNAGGLLGAGVKSTILNSSAKINLITGNDITGGLIGYGSSIKIYNSFSMGLIKSNNYRVSGGIIGSMVDSANAILNVYSYTTINNSKNGVYPITNLDTFNNGGCIVGNYAPASIIFDSVFCNSNLPLTQTTIAVGSAPFSKANNISSLPLNSYSFSKNNFSIISNGVSSALTNLIKLKKFKDTNTILPNQSYGFYYYYPVQSFAGEGGFTTPNLITYSNNEFKFKLSNNLNNTLSIDSITGRLSWTKTLSSGVYTIPILAKPSNADTIRKNATLTILGSDSILSFTNANLRAKYNNSNSLGNIQLPTINLKGKEYTIETWFKLNGNYDPTFSRNIFCLKNSNNDSISLSIPTTLNVLNFSTGNGFADFKGQLVNINFNEWNHFALVLKTISGGTKVSLFINGTELYTNNTSFGLPSLVFTNNYIFPKTGSFPYSSDIEGFKIYQYARTAEQINPNLYNKTLLKQNDLSDVYFYLPASNSVFNNVYIAQNAPFTNGAINSDINSSAIATSTGDTSLLYNYNLPSQRITGFYGADIQNGERLQYSLNGFSWNNVDSISTGLHTWYITIPSEISPNTTLSMRATINGVVNNNRIFNPYKLGRISSEPLNPLAKQGNKLAYIFFTTPTIHDNNIAYYIAKSNPGNITASATTSPILITGLSNGVTYNFVVNALNTSGGISSKSIFSNSVTPPNIYINFINELDSIGKYANFPNNANYLLSRDLDFNNPSSYSNGVINNSFITGAGFTPIANFTGKFNGQGFKIKNLYINQPTKYNIGLFETVQDSIQNILLTNATIVGLNNVGILVGSALKNAVFINCGVTGKVTGIDNTQANTNGVGGFVGNGVNSIFVNSFSKATVNSSTFAGIFGGRVLNSNLSNCFARGILSVNFSSTFFYAGGFIGIAANDTINNSYSASVLKGSQTNIGGFIGLTNTEFSNVEKNVITHSYSNTNFPFIASNVLNNTQLTNSISGVTYSNHASFLNNAVGIYQNNNNTQLPLLFKKGTNILLDSQVFLPIINYSPNNPSLYYALANVDANPNLFYIDGQQTQFTLTNAPSGVTINTQNGILSISRRTLPGNYTFSIAFNNNIDSTNVLYNITIRTSNDSALSFTNTAFTTSTDTANGINGDYIKLPSSLDTSLQRDFTIETWFKVADSSRNQVIMEAISKDQITPRRFDYGWDSKKFPLIKIGINNGKLYAYYPVNSPLQGYNFNVYVYVFGAADSMQSTPINNNVWNHVALVKQSSTVKLYINGNLINTKFNGNSNYNYNTLQYPSVWNGVFYNYYVQGYNDFRISDMYIGRAWENDPVSKSFVGNLQEFKIWNQAITDVNSLKLGTAYTLDNLVYYLPLNNAIYPSSVSQIIPRNTGLKNQSNSFVALKDTAIVLPKVITRVFYKYDSTFQILNGTYSNFIEAGEQLQANTDAVNGLNINANNNIWRVTLPTNFRLGKISPLSLINGTKNNNRPFADFYFVDNPSNPQKVNYINANQRTGFYFLPPSFNGDYFNTNYIVTNNSTGAALTATASPLILNNVNNNIYNFTIQSFNRVKKSIGVVLNNFPLFGTAYTVYTNVNNATGGRIMIDSTVPTNSSLRVTYTTNPGYIIDSILVNGVSVSTDSISGYTFRNISTHQAIYIVFKNNLLPNPVVLQSATPGNATAFIQFIPPVNNGGSGILYYSVLSTNGGINIKTTGSPVTITGLINGATYNFTVIATNKVGNSTPSNIIQVTPNVIYNNIYTSYKGNGTIGVSTGALLSQKARITFSPQSGYFVDSVIINGVTQSKSIVNDVLQADSANGYTFYNIQADSTIQVVFSPVYYTIFTGINVGGIISSNTQVLKGDNAQIIYTIDSNYTFSYALINDNVIERDSTQSYTFTNVQQNNRIVVNNIIKTYNVNTQINNGSISNAVFANKGANVTITYTPNAGYFIDSILINNQYVGNRKSSYANSYTLTNIQNNQQIRVVCKPQSVPDSPTLTNVNIYNNSANVFFDASNNDNGNDILYYTVSTLAGNITATGSTSPINIIGLNPNSAYQFYVTATNSAGISKRSNISQVYITRIPISYIEQLDSIGKYPSYPANGQYNLLNNLDFKNIYSYASNAINPSFTTGAGFNPIANFTGKFFGNGFSISNLYINKPSINDIALFKSSQDTIQGLKLLNVKITGKYNVGTLVAKMLTNGKVLDCYSTGTIIAEDTIGGLVATGKKGTIINSAAKTNIQGNYRMGGIIGFSDTMQIENCYTSGKIDANVNFAGGIAGLARKTNILNCYSLDTINIPANSGGFPAGIIGYTTIANNEVNNITNCFTNLPYSLSNTLNPNNIVITQSANNFTMYSASNALDTSTLNPNYLFQPNASLPILYKKGTRIPLDSQYIKPILNFENINGNVYTNKIINFPAPTIINYQSLYPIHFSIINNPDNLFTINSQGAVTFAGTKEEESLNPRILYFTQQDTQFVDFAIQTQKIKDSIFKISNLVTNFNVTTPRQSIRDYLDSGRYKAYTNTTRDSIRTYPYLFPFTYSDVYNVSPKILLPTLKLDTSFSFETWVTQNTDVYGNTNFPTLPILALGDDTAYQFIFGISPPLPGAGYTINFLNKDTAFAYSDQFLPKLSQIRYNVPFHIAITYKNKTAYIYLNGELIFTKYLYLQNLQNLTNNTLFFVKNLKQLQPGNLFKAMIYNGEQAPYVYSWDYARNFTSGNWVNKLDFKLKDFRIWNYARTDAQINSYYNKPILPNEYGLYYYLPLDTAAYLSSTGIGSLLLPNAATGITALKTNSNAELNDPLLKSTGFGSDRDTSFKFYPNYRLGTNFKLQGSYSDSLLYGETLQYSLNDGQTWINIDSAKDNIWYCYITDSNITSNNIQVRSVYNGFVLKTFNPYPFKLVPLAPAITNKTSYKNNISVGFNPPALNYNGGGASYKLYLDTIPINSFANLNNKIDGKISYIPTKNAQVFNTETSPLTIGNLSYNKKYFVRVAAYNQKGGLIDSNNIYQNNIDPDYISLFGNKDTSSFILYYPVFKVKTTANNGTITPTPNVLLDSNIRITYSPNTGYLLDSIYINQLYNATTTLDSTNAYTFIKVQDTQYIQVVYKKISDTVFMVAGANGQLIPNKAGGFARYGDSVYIAIVPNIGYLIDSVLVNGVKQNGLRPVGDTIKFYPITANHRVEAYFKREIYVIKSNLLSINGNTNGSITRSDTTGNVYNHIYGDSVVFTLTPNVGFALDSLTLRGVLINNQAIIDTTSRNLVYKYVLRGINRSDSLVVRFKSFTFNFRANTINGATISVYNNNVSLKTDTTYKINYGDSIRFTIPVATGYIDTLKIDTNAKIYLQNYPNNVYNYTIPNVQRDHIIYIGRLLAQVPTAPTILKAIPKPLSARIYFKPSTINTNDPPIQSYIVTATPFGVTATTAGSSLSVVQAANFSVNDTSNVVLITGLLSGVTYSFTMVAVNTAGNSVNSNTSNSVLIPGLNTFNIIPTWGVNGQLSISNLVSVKSPYRVLFNGNTGYEGDSVFIDGVFVTKDSALGYTFTNLTSDKYIYVTFKKKTYTVTSLVEPSNAGVVSSLNGIYNVKYQDSIALNIQSSPDSVVYNVAGNIDLLRYSYFIDTIFVNNQLFLANVNAKQYNILVKNVSANTIVKVKFKLVQIKKEVFISYIDQLDSIGKSFNYPDSARYYLVRDLDFNNPTHYTSGVIDSANHIKDSGWRPIIFNGVFDGQNHSISNVYIGPRKNTFLWSTRLSNFNTLNGFFGYLGMGDTIKNLALKNIVYNNQADSLGFLQSAELELSGNQYNLSLGGFFVGTNNGYIQNCSVIGQLNNLFTKEISYFNSIDVGGFVHTNTGTGVILNCVSNLFINDTSAKTILEENSSEVGANSYNIAGFVANNGGNISNSYTNFMFKNPPIISTPTSSQMAPFSISHADGRVPAGFIRTSNGGTINNCYTLSNTNAPFYALKPTAAAEVISITNSYTNALNFVDNSYLIHVSGNDLTGNVYKNIASNNDTAVNNILINNANYLKKEGNFPYLRYSNDTTKLLPNQLKYVRVIIKTGDTTRIDTVLINQRSLEITTLQYVPITNYYFDSIYINNSLYTRDSNFAFTYSDIKFYDVDSIVIIQKSIFIPLNITYIGLSAVPTQPVYYDFKLKKSTRIVPPYTYNIDSVFIGNVFVTKDSLKGITFTNINASLPIKIKYSKYASRIIVTTYISNKAAYTDTVLYNLIGNNIELYMVTNPYLLYNNTGFGLNNNTFKMDSIYKNGVFNSKESPQFYTYSNASEESNYSIYFSKIDPIYINYVNELDSIGIADNYPNDGRYYLVRDLDFNNPAHYSSGVIDSTNHIKDLGWRPLIFNGVFDGQNHSISNVLIGPRWNSTYNYLTFTQPLNGFFSSLGQKDTIKNLHLKNAVYDNKANFIFRIIGIYDFLVRDYEFALGGFFIGTNNGYIENCTVTGQLNNLFKRTSNLLSTDPNFDLPSLDVAGFVYKNAATGVINNCATNVYIQDSTGYVIRNVGGSIDSNESVFYNFAGFVSYNLGNIAHSYTNFNFKVPPVISTPTNNEGYFNTFNYIDNKIPAGFVRLSINGVISNCYAFSNTNTAFYSLRYGSAYSNFPSTITNSYINSLNFVNRVIINTNGGNDLTRYPSKNIASNNDTAVRDTLKSNANYYKKVGYFPYLRYSNDTTQLLPNQIKYIPVVYKNILPNTYKDSALLDLRTNFINNFTLSQVGVKIDSIFLNNVFYAKDSFKKMALSPTNILSNTDTIQIKLQYNIIPLNVVHLGLNIPQTTTYTYKTFNNASDIIYPPAGFLVDSIFINSRYYTNVQDSLGGKIIKNIDSIFRSPVISIKYKRQIIIAHYLQSTPVIDTIYYSLVDTNRYNLPTNALVSYIKLDSFIQIKVKSGYKIDSIFMDTVFATQDSSFSYLIKQNNNKFTIKYLVPMQVTKLGFSFAVDTNYYSLVNNASKPIIIPEGFRVDSVFANGVLYATNVSKTLTVTKNNLVNKTEPPVLVLKYVDSNVLLNYSNSSLLTTTTALSPNNDKIVLPPLDISGAFTLEFWHKSTLNLNTAGDKTLIDFRNAGGGTTGLLVQIASGVRFLKITVDATSQILNLGSGINFNNWNHFAIVSNGNLLKVYINGVLKISANFGNIASATTSNLIGSGNTVGALPATGYFQEFKIWKKELTESTLSSIYNRIKIPQTTGDSLYVYLPLSPSNNILNNSIPNKTLLTNQSSWTGKLAGTDTIYSVNDQGAMYVSDSTNQYVTGYFAGSLNGSERIEVSIDSGKNWSAATTVQNNYFNYNLPSRLYYGGAIYARSALNGVATNKLFIPYSVNYVPAQPVIDTALAFNSQVYIYYKLPYIGNNPISNVNITLSDSLGNIYNNVGTSNPLIISGLTNGTSYKFKIKVASAIGSSSYSSYSNLVTPSNIYSNKDSIIAYSNSSFQTTAVSTGASGDYINLPTLKLDSAYTVETRFKLSSLSGTLYPFIYNFNGWGSGNGLIIHNVTKNLIVKSWETEANGTAEAGISTNGIGNTGYAITPDLWYHLAVVVNGRNTKVYVNGGLIKEYTSLGTNIVNNNTFTNNRIANGQDAGPLSTTAGQYQEFRIWKKPLSASTVEAIANRTPLTLVGTDSLYYYLPLNSNKLQTTNIANGTKLANQSTELIKLSDSSTVISQGGTGAKFLIDSNNQYVQGIYRDYLNTNEKIQISIDSGRSWDTASYAKNTVFYYKLPNRLYYGGQIYSRSVQNNVVSSRAFSPFNAFFIPSIPVIDSVKALNGGAFIYFKIQYNGGTPIQKIVVKNNVNGTLYDYSSLSSPVLVTGLTNGINYTFSIKDSNIVGSSDYSSASPLVTPSNIYANKDSIIAYSNSSFQTTTVKIRDTGDYINLPTLKLDSAYTVETRFKLSSLSGTFYPFIYNFNGWGSGNGLILNNITRELIVKSWATEANGAAVAGISTNGTGNTGYAITPDLWYHLAVVVNGKNTKVYVNGGLIKEYTSLGTNIINNNTFTNNRIANGQDAGPISTTAGQYQEFRIWKKPLSASTVEAIANRAPLLLVGTDSLYYYLPLNSNRLQTTNIANGTKLANQSTELIRLIDSSTVISQGGTGAKFLIDSNNQYVQGIYRDILSTNEKIQISIDSGRSWDTASYAKNTVFYYKLPNRLYYGGQIYSRSVQNNVVSSRVFSPFNAFFIPSTPVIDSVKGINGGRWCIIGYHIRVVHLS